MSELHVGTATAVSVTTTAETVAAAVGPFNFNTPGDYAQGIVIEAALNILLSASTTAVVVRIRRGDIAGALVGVAQTITAAASTSVGLKVSERDSDTIENGLVYVVTVVCTGAASTSTINRAVITAETATGFPAS